MVVSKRAAMARAAQPKGGYARRGAAWAEQSGGVGSIAQTFKTDAQQRISLMELMTRIRTAGIGSDDPRVREIVAELPDADARRRRTDDGAVHRRLRGQRRADRPGAAR